MNRIKEDMERIWFGGAMDFEQDTTSLEDTYDKLDTILNIIDSANVKDVRGCQLAIHSMKKLIAEEDN